MTRKDTPMSTPTPEIVEAAARALWVNNPHGPVTWDQIATHWPTTAYAVRESALEAVAAATPLIEQAVRERVAAEIEEYADATWDLIESPNAARLAFEEVARIARGGTR